MALAAGVFAEEPLGDSARPATELQDVLGLVECTVIEERGNGSILVEGLGILSRPEEIVEALCLFDGKRA
jgi:hypothetical protein